jgi:hypothetical protein
MKNKNKAGQSQIDIEHELLILRRELEAISQYLEVERKQNKFLHGQWKSTLEALCNAGKIEAQMSKMILSLSQGQEYKPNVQSVLNALKMTPNLN